MSIFLAVQASEEIEKGDMKVHAFYASRTTWKEANAMQAVVGIFGILFGGIHCAGWNFPFSSTTESILWRASSLLVTTIPIFLVLRYILFDEKRRSFKYQVLLQKIVWPFTIYIGFPLYIVARITLLILACIALRDLTPSSLTTVEWSSFLPHI